MKIRANKLYSIHVAMFVRQQLSLPGTLSRDCHTDVAAEAATERLKDYPEFNQAECVMDLSCDHQQTIRSVGLPLARSSSLLKTMTDGSRRSAAAAAGCTANDEPRRLVSALSVFSASSFCLFSMPLIWWLSFIAAFANGFRSYSIVC